MKRRFITFVLMMVASVFVAKAASVKVSVINASTVLTDNEVRYVVPALQAQAHEDFAPAWGIDADLTFVPRGYYPSSGSWWLVILDNSDQAGALGYHDVTNEGKPLGKVFAETDGKYGLQWTVTASHELLEMLADPYINLTVFVQPDEKTGTLFAYEVADACESEEYAYFKRGVLVSDFVFPSWFQYFLPPGAAQFDFMNNIWYPFELLPGGYIGVFDVMAGSWHKVTAEAQDTAPPRNGSRTERRAKARHQWLRSRDWEAHEHPLP